MAEKRNIPLATVQKWMQQLLLDPHTKSQQFPEQSLPSESEDCNLETVIKSSKRLSAKEHLAIY